MSLFRMYLICKYLAILATGYTTATVANHGSDKSAKLFRLVPMAAHPKHRYNLHNRPKSEHQIDTHRSSRYQCSTSNSPHNSAILITPEKSPL